MATVTSSKGQPAKLAVSTARQGQPRKGMMAAVVVLFKLRVVALLLLAAVGGAVLGSQGAPLAGDLALLLVTGGLAASGSSALNQYLERHTDGAMKRTSRRPLVTGQIAPRAALIAAVGMLAGSVGLALIVGNPALALFLALGALIYLGIYTLWLKPRSAWNVVIGGAAGSMAVLSGGAAVGGWTDAGVIGLALLLFTWSPTHFWSLALAYRADYQRAGVPMLPVTVPVGRAVFWLNLHTAATILCGLALAAHGVLGVVYAIPVGLATAWWGREAIRLARRPDGSQALQAFKVSNMYLGLVILAICAAALV